MRIYSKTGDKGETGLFGGGRVRKDSLRIEAVGGIDELSANLGVCRVGLDGAFDSARKIDEMLKQIQEELIVLGGELAGQTAMITADHVSQLEKWIDELAAGMEPLRDFILPGGAGAHLHVARTVCRRAERVIVKLAESEDVGEEVLKYVNRLSDLLFTMARFVGEKG